MSETPDLNQILESLLSAPGMTEQLSGALDALTGGNAENKDAPTPAGLPEGLDLKKILQLKSSFDTIKNGRDERINLLLALKPFLNDHRSQNVDHMVKLLRFSKLTGLLKDPNLIGIFS